MKQKGWLYIDEPTLKAILESLTMGIAIAIIPEGDDHKTGKVAIMEEVPDEGLLTVIGDFSTEN
jgi:hypothetical protein